MINESVAYAESGVCRRKTLLSYFGEEYKTENCGSCDNCKHPKEKEEAKSNVVIALKVIKALDERFATDYVINIIIGKITPQVKMYRHEELGVFASGNDNPLHYWNSLVRQLLLEGILKKDIEEYGVLKFTKRGEEFLKKPKSFKIAMNNLFEEAHADDEEGTTDATGGSATDNILLEMLVNLRAKEAKKKSLPPFVVFLESSLQDMATMYPTTLTELEKCQGVSKGKALKFGNPFVEIIAGYVKDNNIERPDDFVMKSVINKSGMKVFIIQQTDKKMPLENIAKNKSVKLDELLEEMETIAASGTRLNLDYAIDEMIDKTEQEEIMDYFKSCETSSLQVAQEELAEFGFNWEQLKIMRIKFLSQYGM